MTAKPMKYPDELFAAVQSHPYNLLFATVSGAHLYGFSSPDSDFDLRGAHILPIDKLLGFEVSDETIEVSKVDKTIELDLVSHDIKKFFSLMLKPNGYVLEQLYSPLIVHASSEHEELKELGKRCITVHHSHHYLGFSANQWKLFESLESKKVKPLLYVFRVLLTGIYLMRTGKIEANLTILNQEFKLPYVDELIDYKANSREKATLQTSDIKFYESEYLRLRKILEEETAISKLPTGHTVKPALEDLLKRLRIQTT
jgi:predicted nucleotidyltransferase